MSLATYRCCHPYYYYSKLINHVDYYAMLIDKIGQEYGRNNMSISQSIPPTQMYSHEQLTFREFGNV